MLSLEEKTACLRRGIFATLDEETLTAVAQRMGERALPAGEVLFLRGEPGDEIFVVVEGGIEIFVETHVIALLGPGELFGEMAVLGGGKRTAGGRAHGETRLLFLKDKAIRLLVQQLPDLAFAIFRVLIERLDEANRLARFLTSEKIELGRLAVEGGELAGQTFPLYHTQAVLGRSQGSVAADALRIALPVTGEDLLDHHARVRIEDGTAYIEPLDGAVLVNDDLIDDCMSVTPADVVTLGGLRLRFVPAEKRG